MNRKKLPIGIESFETIIKDNYYYVDKTNLIADLVDSGSLVTLFTRPRRFGKSLNMSMLDAFFSPDTDKSVFNGLQILDKHAICDAYMGQYPVISVSLKSIQAETFETAYQMAADVVREAAIRVDDQTEDKERLRPADREDLAALLHRDMEEPTLYGSLYTLSRILKRYYCRDVIVLIDEYDVPLSKAWEQGYYNRMVILLRSLFERVLKTNHCLKFAVLTGCMRISKESIFTGMNNLQVRSISDEEYGAYFGFTDVEVRGMLEYYGFSEFYPDMKEWYDGYLFGNTAVYCPWDVTCYCRKLCTDSNHSPENYWANSSGNSVVRHFIEHSSNVGVRSEIEALINGEEVEKSIRQELTYPEMYASIDNLWSVLYTTGYLTHRARMDGRRLHLVIPNQEIRSIFTEQIQEWFQDDVRKDGEMLGRFCDSLEAGDAAGVERELSGYLRRTISIRDNAIRKSMKENFYHGILLGILGVKENWGVRSNEESGDGYSDIIVRLDDYKTAILIEVKYADDGNLDDASRRALTQIDERHYAEKLFEEGFENILKYGIAFYKKNCKVCLTRISGFILGCRTL